MQSTPNVTPTTANLATLRSILSGQQGSELAQDSSICKSAAVISSASCYYNDTVTRACACLPCYFYADLQCMSSVNGQASAREPEEKNELSSLFDWMKHVAVRQVAGA